MAPRAIWSGTISFGMVSIPVRLYTATQSHDVSFHLLHKNCGARLKNVRWCPKHEKAIPWEEVEKGYEFSKGKYVPVSDEDLDKLPVKSVHSVEISDFVKLEDVDPIYFDKAYYLAPEENGVKAFALLRRALEETERAAVAKVAIRDKESLCLVRPYESALTLETMFYANEVRAVSELGVKDGERVAPKELQMAVSLIDNLSDRFEIDKYEDEYQAALRKLLDAKLKGKTIEAPEEERGAEVVDLMEALKASIAATKRKPAASGRRRTATAARTRRRKTA